MERKGGGGEILLREKDKNGGKGREKKENREGKKGKFSVRLYSKHVVV